MWKSIATDYEISTDGQVRSFKRGKPKILKPATNGKGYLRVSLCIDGKVKQYAVHRLVAQAFIPNPDNKPQINHRNGIKSDNRVANLEWCTRSENMRHAVATGLSAQGEDDSQAKLTNADARYIRDNPDGLTGRALANKFGVSLTAISSIQRGKAYRNAGGNIRGSKSPRIPNDIRDEIRRLYVRGSSEFGCYGLAKQFGVNAKTIWNIIYE